MHPSTNRDLRPRRAGIALVLLTVLLGALTPAMAAQTWRDKRLFFGDAHWHSCLSQDADREPRSPISTSRCSSTTSSTSAWSPTTRRRRAPGFASASRTCRSSRSGIRSADAALHG